MKCAFVKRILISISILAVGVLILAGCSQLDSIMSDSGVDAFFAIYKNTEVDKNHKDILSLINIEGKTFDSANELQFSIEEGCDFITLTGTDGVIKTGDVSENKEAILTAKYGEKKFDIRIAVIDEYEPSEYAKISNACVPYGSKKVEWLSYSQIESARVPSTVISLNAKAFAGCKSLKKVYLPDTMTSIGEDAFIDCEKLSEIKLPSDLCEIGINAFRDCAFEEFTIPESVEFLDDFAFNSCRQLKKITIPKGILQIGPKAFQNCVNLEEAIISEGVEILGDSAFSGCGMLTNVQLPNTLKRIEDRAFSYCSSLQEIVIPNSVKDMGVEAFYECGVLKSITMPASLGALKDAFYGDQNVSYVHLTGNNVSYDYTADNYVNTPWYNSRFNKITVEIDEGVKTIGQYYFVKCYGIQSLKIPESVTNISHGAFRKCSSLEEINIPKNVILVDDHAFSMCSALSKVTVGGSVKIIGDYAFSDCPALKEIAVPNSVEKIGHYAFNNCNSLEKISLGTNASSKLKVIGRSAFSGFLVNCKKVDIYSTALKYVGYKAFGYKNKFSFEDSSMDFSNVAFLAKGSSIVVPNANIAKLFKANTNYNNDMTKIKNR